jgi:hypothetical protein
MAYAIELAKLLYKLMMFCCWMSLMPDIELSFGWKVLRNYIGVVVIVSHDKMF